MPNGQLAGWLAWSSVVLVALIGGYFSRSGSILNRRTSTEQMFLDLLKTEKAKTEKLEAEIARLQEVNQALREQALKDLTEHQIEALLAKRLQAKADTNEEIE